ncbi:hypothetical protein [Vallicoccus soli]|uniref:Uncharacterized protein n=1 Tax=Vallicoccus soli TaxID=2339232 RepID=A0A3A3ZLL7_9ACTN|nr:hypothetical protein [Vallicoccus soli]RJK97146.1 hypothetical protein D5H78_08060 [Vallicoccus soli]
MDTTRTGVPAATSPGDPVMSLLAHHVPLTLLLDLCLADGPASREILDAEGVPADAWWAA